MHLGLRLVGWSDLETFVELALWAFLVVVVGDSFLSVIWWFEGAAPFLYVGDKVESGEKTRLIIVGGDGAGDSLSWLVE